MKLLKTLIFLFMTTVAFSQGFHFIDLVYDNKIPVRTYSFNHYSDEFFLENWLDIGPEELAYIYPNPVTDYLINPFEKDLEIYDSQGNFIARTSRKKIFIGDLIAGFYIILIEEESLVIIKN